jgi:hypothetical protein
MKYIITKGNQIVIFSSGFSHKEIANKIPDQVVSAGFINIGGNKIECYGESISLGIKSRPEDTDIAIRRISE